MSDTFDDGVDLLAMIRDIGPGRIDHTWFRSTVRDAIDGLDSADDLADGPGSSVTDIGTRRVERLDRRLAAAASAGDSSPAAELRGDRGGLRATYRENEDGSLDVRIEAGELIEALVEVGWSPAGDSASLRRLVTPLAPTADGWAVRAQLGSVTETEALDLSVPRWRRLDELTSSEVEAAISAEGTYGIAMRAWRELLERHPPTAELATQIEEILRRHGR